MSQDDPLQQFNDDFLEVVIFWTLTSRVQQNFNIFTHQAWKARPISPQKRWLCSKSAPDFLGNPYEYSSFSPDTVYSYNVHGIFTYYELFRMNGSCFFNKLVGKLGSKLGSKFIPFPWIRHGIQNTSDSCTSADQPNSRIYWTKKIPSMILVPLGMLAKKGSWIVFLPISTFVFLYMGSYMFITLVHVTTVTTSTGKKHLILH